MTGHFLPLATNVRSSYTLVIVPRVDAFTALGLELWFNSDDHLPPHFHAENAGKWHVRVFFLRIPSEMFKVAWTTMKGRPNRAGPQSARTAH